MDKKFNTVILSGLLHDVGKLYQRIGTSENKNTYHADLSKEFAEGFISQIWGNIDDYVDRNLLFDLVNFHHKRKIIQNNAASKEIKSLMWLVSEADNLAAKERPETDEQIKNKEKDRVFQLYSIFARFSQKISNVDGYYNQSPLWPEFDLDKRQDKFFNEFANKERVLNAHRGKYGFQQGYNMAYNFMLRACFFLPDFTLSEYPDVSLFVHNSLCSAFAACLYKYHKDKGNLNELDDGLLKEEERDDKKFILYKGGISPVQKFLFDIEAENPKGAAKVLRGKSLLITLWAEAAAFSILHRLGLPVANCLVKSGTNFLLLLPNTEDAKRAIEEVEINLKRFFVEKLFSKINYISYFTEVSSNQIVGDFDSIFKELGKGFSAAKNRPYYNFEDMERVSKSAYEYAKLLYNKDAESGEVSANKFCRFCGVYLKELDGGKDNQGEDNYCFVCSWAKEVGAALTKDRVLISFTPYDQEKNNTEDIVIGDMVIKAGDEKEDNNESILKDSYVSYYLDKEGQTEFDDDMFYSGAVYNSFSAHLPRFKSGDNICYKCGKDECGIDNKEGNIMTFECISHFDKDLDEEGNIVGDNLLAVLKADVDNLGGLIINWLGKEEEAEGEKGKKQKLFTVSRYYMFAFLLDYFFSAVLPYKISQNFPSVYIVYAGGDDLFLIGPWHTIIYLSKRINNWFREYVFEAEGLTLSAGISFFKPKTPLKWAAKEAESALKKAKKDGKNRVCLKMGEGNSVFVLKWDDWRDNEIKKIEDNLCKAVKEDVWGRGRIYRLTVLWQKALKAKSKEAEIEDFLYASHFRYMISRDFEEKLRKDKFSPKQKEIVSWIQEGLAKYFSTDVNEEKLRRLGLPLYMVLIKTRR